MKFDSNSRFAEALSSYGRSTVMRDLAWLVAILVAGSISSMRFAPHDWFTAALAILTLLSALTYLVLYIYFALTDKESLRSDRYSIHKLAIEHGLFGDDSTGLKTATIKEVIDADTGARNKEDTRSIGP